MNVKLILFGYTIARLDITTPTPATTTATVAPQPVIDNAIKGASSWWMRRMLR